MKNFKKEKKRDVKKRRKKRKKQANRRSVPAPCFQVPSAQCSQISEALLPTSGSERVDPPRTPNKPPSFSYTCLRRQIVFPKTNIGRWRGSTISLVYASCQQLIKSLALNTDGFVRSRLRNPLDNIKKARATCATREALRALICIRLCSEEGLSIWALPCGGGCCLPLRCRR